MSENRSLRQNLSCCDEKMAQKEAKIGRKDRQIKMLTPYNCQTEEVIDKEVYM